MIRLALAAALALLPAAGEPHAFLLKSSPARRAVLRQAPPRVELWFNERLERAYSTASVTTEAGARVDRADASVDPTDGRRLSVSLPPLTPGGYVVRFRVLSVDGHVVEASYPFTVKGRQGPRAP